MRDDLRILQMTLRAASQDGFTDMTLARTIEALPPLTGWQSVSLLQPSAIPGKLTVIASAGSLILPNGATVLSTALTPAQNNTSNTVHYVADTGHLATTSPVLQAIGSMIVITLAPYGHTWATLLLISDHRDGFDDQDLALAETLHNALVLTYPHTTTDIKASNYLHAGMAAGNEGMGLLDNELHVSRLKEPPQDRTETMIGSNQALREHLSTTHALTTPDSSDQPVQREERQVVDYARTTAHKVRTTLNEFIDANQLEGGEMLLSPSAFSLTDLVENVLQLEQPLAQSRHLNLEKCCEESLPLTWGDRHLIQRVLEHTIAYVLKTTPPGGGVQVEADSAPPGGDTIRVSISKTPPSDSHIPRSPVAEPTHEEPQDHDDIEHWSAFCRVVLEAHGERMWLSHATNTGKTVTFTLPQVSESLAQFGIRS